MVNLYKDWTAESYEREIASLKAGREEAVKLVLDAGLSLSTGHADTCGDLMLEVLGEIESLRYQNERLKNENDAFVTAALKHNESNKEIETVSDALQKAGHRADDLQLERDELQERLKLTQDQLEPYL